MKKIVKIFDTTLRDGEQSPGCSMNRKEKVQLAYQIEKLGVDVIEAGFAASSVEDFNSIREVAKIAKNMTVASLARCNKNDIDRAYEALKDAKYKRLHIFIATSDIHMEYKLEMTREDVKNSVRKHVTYAKEKFSDIEFSCEDATRTDVDFMIEVIQIAVDCGATTINIPDTVGYIMPDEYSDIIKKVREKVVGIENVDISVHCHNDLGLAVANSLAAIKAGATQVECTINGIGERAGNTAMEEVVMALKTRGDFFNIDTNINTKEIMKSSEMLSSIIGVKISPTKPIVGKNVFSHEAGIHQHGVLKNKETYEIMDPSMIGYKANSFVLGKHSGKHALKQKLEELGFIVNDIEMNDIFEKFKEVSDVKKEIYDDDLIAIMSANNKLVPGGYEFLDYQSMTSNGKDSKTIIKVKKDDREIEMLGTGKGPIDAAFDAMRKITSRNIKLKDFSINSVTQGKDALGETIIRVYDEDTNRTLGAKGLDNDIIKSGILSYINAVNRIER
ncbi:2-isopropylmalate synthase [Peptoniphilus sp. AGMB00490]|uniref:2-isopropylmalate synthase n=1 Tax=Peptoniphilus faecalis TaxID=2731255 RepID=A0A848RGL7_9FIRM|nr:2-isopropylmalate synthase [Peptoniphilus faecalis]NMW84881.1 2-isopropylmalate synthase [Peptoniphilus faecalis]